MTQHENSRVAGARQGGGLVAKGHPIKDKSKKKQRRDKRAWTIIENADVKFRRKKVSGVILCKY